MTTSYDLPDPDDRNKAPDPHNKSELFSSISLNVDRPDVLWYMAREGNLDNYESPNSNNELTNSGVTLSYADGELKVVMKVKSTIRDSFTPEDQQKRKFRADLRTIVDGEISCNWKERTIEIASDDKKSTLSWPEPSGMVFDSLLEFTTSIGSKESDVTFENSLQTALELFRLYSGYACTWAERKVPRTSLTVKPPDTSIREYETLSPPSDRSRIAVAENDELLKPLKYREEVIRRGLALARSEYSLDDIIDMPEAVETLKGLTDGLAHSFDPNSTITERHLRRILIVEGRSHERSRQLINGLAGSISAKVIFVEEEIATTDKVAELRELRDKYHRFYNSKLENTESRRTLFVLTVPKEEYGTASPFLSQATADDLYRAFNDDSHWKDMVVVFVANSAEDLQKSIQNRALVTVSSDDRGTDYSRVIQSKLMAMSNRAKDTLSVESMDYKELADKLAEDGCQTYSDVVDAVERSFNVAFIRNRKQDPDSAKIIITEDDILSGWTMVKLQLDASN